MDFNAKKRRVRSFSFVFLAAVIALSGVRPAAGDVLQLKPDRHEGTLLRVKTVVEVAGSLKVDSSEKGKAKSIPMKVDAEMFFDELGTSEADSASVRHYWKAFADLEVNETKSHRELRKDRQLVLLSGDSLAQRFSSPYGPLQRQELELLDVATNAFPLERLLPNKEVEEDEEWTLDTSKVAELLRVENVERGDIICKVDEVDEKEAKISLNGKVDARVDGVKTQIDVVGKYHFKRKQKFVSWIALAVKEKRDIGFSSPGFDVVARIRMARQRIDKSDALAQKTLKSIRSKPNESDLLLDFVSADNFYKMALDRRWFLLNQHKSSAKLRMVDGGDLLATCKVDQLTKSLPGKQVTLDGFRGDVQTALGKNCKEILSASESVNAQNVRVMRVVAAGEVSETPIRWIYYHLSNDDGYRLSVIFTHEASLESRFAGTDETMTSSVAFLPQPKESQETERQAQANGATRK